MPRGTVMRRTDETARGEVALIEGWAALDNEGRRARWMTLSEAERRVLRQTFGAGLYQ